MFVLHMYVGIRYVGIPINLEMLKSIPTKILWNDNEKFDRVLFSEAHTSSFFRISLSVHFSLTIYDTYAYVRQWIIFSFDEFVPKNRRSFPLFLWLTEHSRQTIKMKLLNFYSLLRLFCNGVTSLAFVFHLKDQPVITMSFNFRYGFLHLISRSIIFVVQKMIPLWTGH